MFKRPIPKLNNIVLVFVEGGKPENPKKNPRRRERTNNETNPHETASTRESNPGHRGGRRALIHCAIRAPLCSHKYLFQAYSLLKTQIHNK